MIISFESRNDETTRGEGTDSTFLTLCPKYRSNITKESQNLQSIQSSPTVLIDLFPLNKSQQKELCQYMQITLLCVYSLAIYTQLQDFPTTPTQVHRKTHTPCCMTKLTPFSYLFQVVCFFIYCHHSYLKFHNNFSIFCEIFCLHLTKSR